MMKLKLNSLTNNKYIGMAPTDFNPRLIVVFVQLQIFAAAHEYLQRERRVKFYEFKTQE
jgi:hypothetical protein